MEQILLQWEPVRHQFTVSELSARIRGLFLAELNDIWVSGEISGVRLAASGHYYFTLKDEQSQVKCACFRMTARYLKFKPQEGVAVLARGRLDLYEARGEYQLLVETLEPQGFGALQFAFEQLKKKLGAEGLFEAARKRPLPKLPRRIGIVTSASGSVIQDMLQIFERRFPGLHIRLYPAQVQGDGSVAAVCRAIRYFSESGWAEAVIVARGGGSIEDLWTFNEEDVAREIAACAMPVISAIGHETDFTIADFTADLRAPTPSAAAELVICTREQLLERLGTDRRHLEQAMRYRLSMISRRLNTQGMERASSIIRQKLGRAQQRLDEFEYCLRDQLRGRLRASGARLDSLESRLRKMDLRLRFAGIRSRLDAAQNMLQQSTTSHLSRTRSRLLPCGAHLAQLSPVKILERGYAIVQDSSGVLVKDAASVQPGQAIEIRLARGRLAAEVRNRSIGG